MIYVCLICDGIQVRVIRGVSVPQRTQRSTSLPFPTRGTCHLGFGDSSALKPLSLNPSHIFPAYFTPAWWRYVKAKLLRKSLETRKRKDNGSPETLSFFIQKNLKTSITMSIVNEDTEFFLLLPRRFLWPVRP